MKQYIPVLCLVAIVLVGFVLRIAFLGKVPPSLNWDEVALGYNAYSLWETGRDEYGKFLPVVLRSFDDYKPALYAYLVIPSIAVFGLTTFAVRVPSMLFGTLTVLATYFLVKEIFSVNSKSEMRNSKQIQNPNEQNPKHWTLEIGHWKLEILALLTAFLLAISPWHLQFSRIAFESNVGLAFNVFGALFFVKGLKNPWYLLLSAIVFGINPSMYQSDKVFTPLFVIALAVVYWKKLWNTPKKFLIASVVVGIMLLLPTIIFHLTDEQALSRAQGVSVFSDQTEFLKENVKKLQIDRERGDIIGLIFDNRRVEFAKAIVAGYLSHFDLNWLFINGDIARHHAPNMGLLYLFELPFLLIGVYQLFFGKFTRSAKLTVFLWFLLAPVPAMITSGVPHAVRTLNFLPTFQLLTALGMISSVIFLEEFRRKHGILQIVSYSAYVLFTIVFLFNFLFYLNQYFVQQNSLVSKDWLYGYEDAVSKVKQIEGKYDRVIVSNQPALDQSYMFFLFYLQYPPELYQKESVEATGGFRENHTFGKYEFRPIDWNNEASTGKTLYIGRPGDFSEGVQTLYKVEYLDGTDAILITERST